MLNDKNFIKWLTLKAFFIINKVSNDTKIAIIFIAIYKIYFLLAHFYFKCNLMNPEYAK